MQRILRASLTLIATGVGVGLSPYMPGTMGTIVGVFIAYGLTALSPVNIWICYLIICVLSYFAAHDRGLQMHDHDHKSIVCDEIIGILPVLVMYDYGWKWLTAFIVFRFFDILKPWPISFCDQQIKGALGCLLDDLLAGVLTFVVLLFVY